MAKYVNSTLGVVNVGGQVVAPATEVELGDKTRGLDGLLKTGVLAKAEKPKPQKPPKVDPPLAGE